MFKKVISVITACAFVWLQVASTASAAGYLQTLWRYDKGLYTSGFNAVDGTLTATVNGLVDFTYYIGTDGSKVKLTQYEYDPGYTRINRITDMTTGKYIQYGEIKADANGDGFLETVGWGALKEYGIQKKAVDNTDTTDDPNDFKLVNVTDENGNPVMCMIGKYVYDNMGKLSEKLIYNMDATSEAEFYAERAALLGNTQEDEEAIAAMARDIDTMNVTEAELEQAAADAQALVDQVLADAEALQETTKSESEIIGGVLSALGATARDLIGNVSTLADLKARCDALAAERKAEANRLANLEVHERTVDDGCGESHKEYYVVDGTKEVPVGCGGTATANNEINAATRDTMVGDLRQQAAGFEAISRDAAKQLSDNQGILEQVAKLIEKAQGLKDLVASKAAQAAGIRDKIDQLSGSIEGLQGKVADAKAKAQALLDKAKALEESAENPEVVKAAELLSMLTGIVDPLVATLTGIVNNMVTSFRNVGSYQAILDLIGEAEGALSGLSSLPEEIAGLFSEVASIFGDLKAMVTTALNSKSALGQSMDPEEKGRVCTSKIVYKTVKIDGKDTQVPDKEITFYESRQKLENGTVTTTDVCGSNQQDETGNQELSANQYWVSCGLAGKVTKQWNYDKSGHITSITQHKLEWKEEGAQYTTNVDDGCGDSHAEKVDGGIQYVLTEVTETTTFNDKGAPDAIYRTSVEGPDQLVGTFTYNAAGQMTESYYKDVNGMETTTYFDPVLGRPSWAVTTGTKTTIQDIDGVMLETSDGGTAKCSSVAVKVDVKTITMWEYNDTGGTLAKEVLEAKVNALKEELAPKKAELASLEAQLAELQAQDSQDSAAISELQGKIKALNDEIAPKDSMMQAMETLLNDADTNTVIPPGGLICTSNNTTTTGHFEVTTSGACGMQFNVTTDLNIVSDSADFMSYGEKVYTATGSPDNSKSVTKVEATGATKFWTAVVTAVAAIALTALAIVTGGTSLLALGSLLSMGMAGGMAVFSTLTALGPKTQHFSNASDAGTHNESMNTGYNEISLRPPVEPPKAPIPGVNAPSPTNTGWGQK